MNFDHAIIDQIVNGVLEQLQPTPAKIIAPVETKPVATTTEPSAPSSSPLILELSEPVITAELLAKRLTRETQIRIGGKSLITPAARDWLKSRGISFLRGAGNLAAAGSTSNSSGTSQVQGPGRWQLIVTTVTKGVQALMDGYRRSSPLHKLELSGLAIEAADSAIGAICKAECDGVLIFSEHADWIACRANRNSRIRAAVAFDRTHLQKVLQSLDANVICSDPTQKTYIELRRELEVCLARIKPSRAGEI